MIGPIVEPQGQMTVTALANGWYPRHWPTDRHTLVTAVTFPRFWKVASTGRATEELGGERRRQDLLRGPPALLHEQPGSGQDGVLGLRGFDPGQGVVGLLDVGAGMSEQSYGAKMEESRSSRGPHLAHHCRCHIIGVG